MPVRTPDLPAPRRVDMRAVSRWVGTKIFGQSGYDHVYADNSPTMCTEFNTDDHRKYNGAAYFGQEPLLQGSAYARWKIEHANRSKEAQTAYDDFLRGLEIVGAQEYVSSIPKKMTNEEAQAILQELGAKTDSKNPKKDLRELADWERLIQLRKDAPLRRVWYMGLQHRAEQPLKDDPAPGLHPPIRMATFKLLVRQPETDFDLFKAFMLVFTVGTLMQAFVTQILEIFNLCSSPFMCPARCQSGWRHRPVPAPPLAFRQDGIKSKTKKDTGGLAVTCGAASGGCKDPGYKLQWPYIQLGADGTQFPANDLQALCTATIKGTEGYMYDPYESKLIAEYWKCDKDMNEFSNGGIDFHFEKDWYDLANDVTLTCMEDIMTKGSFEARWNEFNTNEEYRKKLEFCFFNDPSWKLKNPTGGGVCDCRPSRPLYYLHSVDVNTVNKHQLYGCMFDSPSAAAPMLATYHPCSTAPRNDVFNGKYNLDDESRALEAKEYGSKGASRRATLIAFFVIKEAGPLGGVLALGVIGFFFAIFFLPTLLIVQIYCLVLPANQRTHFKASMWHLAENLWGELTMQAWATSTAMSSLFRAYDTFIRVAFSSGINGSIIKDGIGKVTAVLNILFNLILLVLSETSFADGGALWASVIQSTVNVVLQILLEKEKLKFHAAFLKDINENRLNKFEIGLGLTKLLEDFGDEDVTFNFVQHLYGSTRVRPAVMDEFEEAERRQPGWFREKYSAWDQNFEEDEHRVANGKTRDFFCCGPIQNQEQPTIFPFYPLLPKGLVEKFGHDGKFEWKSVPQVAGNPSMSAAGKGVVMSPMPAIPMQAVQSSMTPGVPYFGVMPNPQNSISYAEGRAPRYPANMPPQQPNGLIGPVVGFPETGY